MGKDLKTIVAEIAKVDAASVDGKFSLQTENLAASIKKAQLIASIRRHLGVDCMQAGTAKTFEELERMVAAKKS